MQPLTKEQEQYLNERGFAIIYSEPPKNEPYPFITLREPQRYFEQSEITFHQNRWARTGTGGICHPTNRAPDFLVETIEEIVGGNMNLDGKVFDTKLRQPIKVFVIDQAWKDVAEVLASKYTKPLEE